MTELMGHGIHILILHTVWSHPEGSDHVVVGAAVGCAFERLVEHDHHTVSVGIGLARIHKFKFVVVEIVKFLHFAEEIVGIYLHILSLERGRFRKVVAEAFRPEKYHVVGGFGATPIPLAVLIFEVHGAELLRDVDFFTFRRTDGDFRGSFRLGGGFLRTVRGIIAAASHEEREAEAGKNQLSQKIEMSSSHGSIRLGEQSGQALDIKKGGNALIG